MNAVFLFYIINDDNKRILTEDKKEVHKVVAKSKILKEIFLILSEIHMVWIIVNNLLELVIWFDIIM